MEKDASQHALLHFPMPVQYPRREDESPDLADLEPGVSSRSSRKPRGSNSPLVPVAVGLAAGIALDSAFCAPPYAALLPILCAAILILLGLRHRRPAISALAVALAATSVGMLRHAIADRYLPANHIARRVADEPLLVHLRGRIVTPPEVTAPDPEVVTAYARDPRTRFMLEAMSLDGATGPIAVRGLVSVGVAGAILFREVGDIVEMTGWLHAPRGPRNPGEPDWAQHHRRQGVHAAFSCAHAESVRLIRLAATETGPAPMNTPAPLDRPAPIDGQAPSDLQAPSDRQAPTESPRRWLDRLRTHLRGYLIEHPPDPGADVEGLESPDGGASPDGPASSHNEAHPDGVPSSHGGPSSHGAASGLLTAIVLGGRSAVPREVDEAFRRSAATHLLAASGLQVAWVALLGWTAARALGLYYRTTALVVAGLMVSYVMIAEPQPSMLRAGIVGVMVCGAAFFRGRFDSINALAASALVILLLNPGDLFSIGFQFSFLATVGLLFVCPVVSRRLARLALRMGWPRVARALDTQIFALGLIQIGPWPGQAPSDLFAGVSDRSNPPSASGLIAGTKWRAVGAWCGVAIAQLASLSLTEWMVTTPLACYRLDQFSPWGWATNFVLAIPAMPATLLGYVTLIAGLIVPSSGAFLIPLATLAGELLIDCAQFLAELPGALAWGRNPSVWWAISVYGLMGWWLFKQGKQTRRPGHTQKWVIRSAVMIVSLWWVVPPRWVHRDADALVVWMLAVGDGTATVLEMPDGEVHLYDFGSRSPVNLGALGRNFSRARGITGYDTAVVSHADFDHYSGLMGLAKEVGVSRVVINDHFEKFAEPKDAATRFLEMVRSNGIPLEVSTDAPGIPGASGPGEVVVEQLWPPPTAQRRFLDANDTSIVLRLMYAGRRVLLTGDIGETAMAALMKDETTASRLRADVLALPHHGAVVSNTSRFIEQVSPKFAVRSTGQRRDQTTNNIERLVRPGNENRRQYWSTADHGCIKITVRADGELIVEAPFAPSQKSDSDNAKASG